MRVAILVFDGVDLMDVAVPLEVLGVRSDLDPGAPGIEPVLVSVERKSEVVAAPRMVFRADTWIGQAEGFDAVIVPGGKGLDTVFDTHLPAVKAWLEARDADPRTRWMTSVCAGSLLLGMCGLLDGHRATTHWASLGVLGCIRGLTVVEGFPRVVISGDRMTSGGVSSGAELAFELKRRLLGEQSARNTELILQYDPQPPFGVGTPAIADPKTLAESERLLAPMVDRRRRRICGAPGRPGE